MKSDSASKGFVENLASVAMTHHLKDDLPFCQDTDALYLKMRHPKIGEKMYRTFWCQARIRGKHCLKAHAITYEKARKGPLEKGQRTFHGKMDALYSIWRNSLFMEFLEKGNQLQDTIMMTG